MKLKIGFDAKRLFHNYTGLGNYSRTLVANLSARYGENEYLLFAKRTSQNAEAVEFLSERYVVVAPVGSNFLWRAKGMCKEIKSENIDIFHGLSHDLPIGIKKSGAKSVVTIHDVCYRTFPAMFSITERLIYSFKYRHSLKNADRIIAISESTKSDILKFFGTKIDGLEGKIDVVYQAINPVFYESVNMAEAVKIIERYRLPERYMLYVGSINSRKNLLAIVKAYALLDDNERLPLVVVGSGGGKYATRCFEAAEKLGVSQYIVRIEGVSSMTTLRAFYSCAAGLVYPSYYEGFGLPVTEAILCGVPVVTSMRSSLPEAGGDSAFYVDPDSEQQIAYAIKQILNLSADERQQLTEAAREWALQKFDSDRLTAQIEDLYEKLLK